MEKTQLKRKRIRAKITCRVCQQTFDDDYRKQHNKKYHGDLLQQGKHIRTRLREREQIYSYCLKGMKR